MFFWSSYFHFKFTQIQIIMFSKGLWFTVGREFGLVSFNEASRFWRFSLIRRDRLSPGSRRPGEPWHALPCLSAAAACGPRRWQGYRPIPQTSEEGTLRDTFSSFIRSIDLPKCFKSKRTFQNSTVQYNSLWWWECSLLALSKTAASHWPHGYLNLVK